MAAKIGKVKITLVKSPIGSKPKHRKTVKALGLRKIRQTIERDATPSIMGMARSVGHLVSVEEIG